MSDCVRIVILNYRGEKLLPVCLPSIVHAAAKSPVPAKVTLLHNPSEENDDGLDYVTSHFPEVEIVRAPKNLILGSYNAYLKTINEPIVILLNNDIRVDEGFIAPAVSKFRQDPLTFLVAPKVMNFEGTHVEAGRSKSGVRLGLFWCESRYPGYEKDIDTPSETISSGFGAFDRIKFLELGGYDPLYFPGIMEDVDLSLRALRAGFHLYYEPASIVYHMGQASFKNSFGVQKTLVLAHRNTFLFMWKNFNGFQFLAAQLLFIPLRILFNLLRGRPELCLGFWGAVKKQFQKNR